MLSIFETFAFVAFAIFIVTQMIIPAALGKSLFPLFHTNKRERELEVVRRLREDIELQQAIDGIIKDLGTTEHMSEDERKAALQRLKDNTDKVAAKLEEHGAAVEAEK